MQERDLGDHRGNDEGAGGISPLDPEESHREYGLEHCQGRIPPEEEAIEAEGLCPMREYVRRCQ